MANTEELNRKKAIKKLGKLNALFTGTSKNISSAMNDTPNDTDDTIIKLNSDVDNIITQELNQTKSITSDDMSTFLVKLFNDFDKTGIQRTNMDDIFENDSAGLFQFFQQRYQNQNLLFEDLNMVTSQLFELDEAVMTTRDAIVTSDDITKTISRTLKFNQSDENGEDNKYATYTKAIEELERRTKVLVKLKNVIIPNALTYGTYYAYVCPYSKLFQEQYERKMKDPTHMYKVSESIDDTFINTLKTEIITEDLKRQSGSKEINKIKVDNNDKDLSKLIKSYTENIQVYNDTVSIPLIEGVDLTELIDNEKFNKTRDKYTKMGPQTSSDGIYDINDKKNHKKYEKMFENQTGCYIKYIEPKKMIPIKLLDTTIGYYYIHDTDFTVTKSPFATSIRVTTANGVPYQNTEDVETLFLGKITDKIVSAFDKPFLENNPKFKDLILNALIYNNMYKKEIKFQFIPAEYVVEFKINEDPEGNGQSMLTKALFYAKLYLALLVFKMVSIVTRSNDTRIYYVKNSGIDQSITNKVQEVARSIKGRQINFMDLLNYNSIISKIGAYKELFIPVGRSGDRSIEFDTLAGQDVPLNTDLMEMLRTNMINGTGVPSVIMNYINEADYAKTLSMANSKFVGRVISYQIDLNGPTTDFYKLLVKHSNISIPDNIMNMFEFYYNTPRTLNTINMSDMISNADQVINAAIKAVTGENSEQTDENNHIKDKIYNILLREFMPMLNWASIDTAKEQAILSLRKDTVKKEANTVQNKEENQGY